MKSNLVVLIALLLISEMTAISLHPVQADTTLPLFTFKAPMSTPRGQAAIIAADDGLVYAIGGNNESYEVMGIVEAYDPATDTWTTRASLLNSTRGAAVAKGLNGIIYVFGGYDGGALSTVQAYNTTSNVWSLKASLLTPVWMAGAATGNDGKIYVVGGENPFGSAINTLQIYDPETDAWTTGPNMPDSLSLLGVVKGPDGNIYAMGGYDGSEPTNSVYVYYPVFHTWSTPPLIGMMMPRLEFGLTLGPDGKFYIIGGGTEYSNNSPPVFDRVDSYDPHILLAWKFEALMPTARKELGATTASNGKIYIIGGSNGTHYVDLNLEMTVIAEPENQKPKAYIDSISPNPAPEGQAVSLIGHGSDFDGSIAAYKWRSSIDGTIGTAASFNTATLSVGTHNIYFSVKDDRHIWSDEVMAVITIVNYTADPNYQQISKLNQTANDLKQQNNQLNNQVDDLNNQIANLNSTVNDLSNKLDLMTLELLSTGIITLILIIVLIALMYMKRTKKPMSTQTTLQT